VCPFHPPQTAFGRAAGSWLGSATVPVAVFGVAPKTVSQTEWFHPCFRRDTRTSPRDARPQPLISGRQILTQRRKGLCRRSPFPASWHLCDFVFNSVPAKAPEGWRTPRRFAPFGGQRSTRQRPGLRWPSTAFSSRTQPARNFKRPLPRSSNPNCLWPRRPGAGARPPFARRGGARHSVRAVVVNPNALVGNQWRAEDCPPYCPPSFCRSRVTGLN
jgi:hypothetical protein